MKKKSRLKSFFAILLAVSMVFQQSSLTVLATDDTYAEDVTATPTPSESEAEEYTEEEAEPEAQEPEEPAAEEPEAPQEEPETPAEEPAQEPTEAPAAEPTEAPAEVTEAPAAPEVTETPAAEATATPTPEVSVVPSETPTPTPTEAPKTSFRYEDSRVVITATAPEDANLPQDAEIKADYIAPGTERYNAAVAAFNSQLSSQLGLNSENTTAEYVLYDVYFLTSDGNRIEPESGNVTVDMSFKKIQESSADGDIINKDVVHLDNDGQAEVVTEYVNTNADGEITSMGFTQDSFSIVGGVTTYDTESGNAVENENTEALDSHIKAVTITDYNDKLLEAIKPDQEFKVNIQYEVGTHDLEKDGQWHGTLTYQLPGEIKAENLPLENLDVIDSTGDTVGKYSISETGLVTIVLDHSKFSEGTTITGTLSVASKLNKDNDYSSGNVNIEWTSDKKTDLDVIVPRDLTIAKKCSNVEYVENDEKIKFDYEVVISTTTGTDDIINLTDELKPSGKGSEFERSVAKVELCKADGTKTVLSDINWDADKNGENAALSNLPKLGKGESYIITYTTSEKIGKNKIHDTFTEQNTATASTKPKYGEKLTTSANSNPSISVTSSDYTDINIEKTGNGTLDQSAGKIEWKYKVKVSSTYGTKDQKISFVDKLTNNATGTTRKIKEDSITVTKVKADGARETKNPHNLKVNDGNVSTVESSGTEILSGELDPLGENEYYEIEYIVEETGVNPDASTTTKITGSNKAKVTTKDYPDGKEDKSTPSVEWVGDKLVPGINKEGKYDGESKINWTITVNGDHKASLIGNKVVDELLKNGKADNNEILCVVKDISVSGEDRIVGKNVKLPVSFSENSDGKTIMTDANGITYELSSDKAKVQFTYATTVDLEGASSVTYKNTGKLGTGDDAPKADAEVTVKDEDLVEKELSNPSKVDNNGHIILHWNIKINVPSEGIKSGAEISDWPSVDNDKCSHYFTLEQLKNIKILDSKGKVIDKWKFEGAHKIPDNTYIQDLSNVDSDAKFKSFCIKLTGDITQNEIEGADKSIVISYDTTADVSDLAAATICNFRNAANIKINGNEYKKSDSFSYEKEGETGNLVKKTNWGSEDGSYLYDSSGTRLYYKVVLNGNYSAKGEITYTDTFPENTSLVTDRWSYNGINYGSDSSIGYNGVYFDFENDDPSNPGIKGWNSAKLEVAQKLGITVTNESGGFTVKIPEEAHTYCYDKQNNKVRHAKIILYYALDYKVPEDTTPSFPIQVENKGSATCENESGKTGTISTIETKVVDKTVGEYNQQKCTLPYQVTFDEKGVAKEGQILKATDTFNYVPYNKTDGDRQNRIVSVSILPGSVSLYYLDDSGNKVSVPGNGNLSFNDDNENGKTYISVDVPYTGHKYYLEYTYEFEFANMQKFDLITNNRINLDGKNSDVWSSSVEKKFTHIGSGATANTDNTKITLVKKEKGKEVFLEGAEFTLEKWDGSNWLPITNADGKTIHFTTGTDGTVEIGEVGTKGNYIKYYYLYRLKEVKSPNGYQKNNAAEFYYIYLEGGNGSADTAPSLPENFDKKSAITVKNHYIYIENEKVVTVEGTKIWKAPDGEKLPEKITVILNQNGVQYDTKTVTAEDNWTYKWENLPEYDANGKAYSYTIDEEPVAGYQKEVSGTNLINTKTGTTEIEGTKIWKAPDGEKLPEKITVILNQNGVQYDTKIVTAANNWTYKWENLPEYDANGKAYVYTIDEVEIAGYQKDISGTNLINTKTGTTKIEGTKSWKVPDGEKLPDEITVILNQNGVQYDTKTVTAANNWTYKWENLPEYDAEGNAYVYTIDEEPVAGYQKEVSGTNLINTKTGTTEIEGTKIWKAPDGEKLPEKITVILNQNGVQYDTKTVTAANNWTYKWENLPEYDANGKAYVYTIDEVEIAGYQKDISGTNLINTKTGTTEIEGTKSWKVPDGEKLPDEITVILNQNGVQYDTKTVTAANNWTYKWENLPEYDAEGNAYVYTIDEEPVVGYQKEVSGTNLINTKTGTTEIEGTKTWKVPDGEKLPDEITVILNQNGVQYATKTVTAANNWTYKWENLPEYDANGKAYSYTIDEEPVAGYQKEVSGTNLINTKTGTTEIEGTKSWKVPDGEKLPEKITVILNQNGVQYDTKTVTAANNWTYKWENLPEYDANGKAYVYTIDEVEIAGYQKDISGTNLINTKTGTTEIEGTKSWKVPDGEKLPDEITVILNQNGVQYATKTVTAANNWTYKWENLPEYDANGKAYVYTIDEVEIAGYQKDISGTNLINTKTGTTEIEGTKSWKVPDGEKLPDEITVILNQNGVQYATKTVTAANNWTYKWENLPEYDANGKAYSYTIDEEPVAGYQKEVSGTNLINTKTGTTEIEGTKSWKVPDGEKLPEKITVILNQNGVQYDTKTVTAANNWTYKWENLPEYDANGKAYVYTIDEVEIAGYQKDISGTNLINTKTGTTEIEGTKSWKVPDGEKLPDEITVILNQNGVQYATKTVTAANNWTYKWENLPEYDANGKAYVYTIDEVEIAGYQKDISGTNLINTKTGTTEIEGTKSWKVPDGEKLPDEITVILNQNGVQYDTKKVTAEDNWTYKWENLPAYDADGKVYVYTIDEVEIAGYQKNVSGYDLTNSKIVIDKTDESGSAIAGAKLKIIVKNATTEEIVDSWTSAEEVHDITGKLVAGIEYILEESSAPTGYAIAKSIAFTVTKDGVVIVDGKPVSGNKLTMVDAKIHFNVNKVELDDETEVEGAHLAVIDKETGETVDEWISAIGEIHDFGSKLVVGKNYILREVVAPAGYKYAKDIEFTVKADGSIETNAKTTTDTDGNKVYLVEDDTTKATIAKVDALGNQLSGVVLEIQDKDGNPIDSWTTDGTPHVITGKLILGETYTLVEKSAPKGYALAKSVEFTVSADDTDNVVTMVNTYSASGKLNLTAKKTLTTTETPLTEGQFTFVLCDKDGTVLQTKTNAADGNVIFDAIEYNLVKDAAYKDGTDKKVDATGDYLYTVKEVKDDASGYTYDDTIYTINVTVEDAGDGTLTVTPVIHSSKSTSEDATVEGMEFNNTYKTSGQIVLSANKTLEGQTLEAEQFSFQATEIGEDGNAVENGYNETVKNADGGAITFPIITYEKSGTHYYQITEVNDEKPAYKYDESKYVVKVEVTDDNAGNLTAKITSVTKDGEPVESEDLTGAVTFTNTYSASAELELKAQKSMKVEGEELGTFEFELKDADGNVIETVKNDENGAINFSKLSYDEKAVGQTFTYTVNEKIPSEADIYVYDNTVYTVTVEVEDNRDGTLKLTTKVNGEDYTEEAIKFVNDTTKVTISKVDDTSLKALSGAKLQVVDADDKVVEEWVSDGTPHVITAKLVLGATYKLVEAEAPLGYEIAEPITFTVDADDTKNAVEMKDAMTKSETAAIEITKELKLNDALAGAKDMTFYVALFADEECTILASDVKALEFKNASSSTVTFTGVDLGRTYYVSETDESGKEIDSGMTPDGKVYIPAYPQGKEITVTEDGAKSSITFENQFNEWPDGFYKIANLNVTKELLGADGNALESDGVFYAGIFDDKECTTLSTRTEKNILTLDLAGGSTVSESTQAVVMPGESFNLYVAETDAEGNLVAGTEGFKYVVTVKDGNVYFDENNLNAKVTIINQEQPEATPTVTPEETPTPTPSSSTGVKTGDDTPIGFYMAMLFLAALAIEETTRRRRKKEQD